MLKNIKLPTKQQKKTLPIGRINKNAYLCVRFYVLNKMNTLLLSILSLIMTWTVETKSTISSSGDVPAAVQAVYACSYQKGTVRNGDNATLTLSGLGGVAIERIEMHMRSNKSAGAGVISVYADGARIAQKEGSLRDWIGKYDNSAFHPIEVFVGQQTIHDSLVIHLAGTTNSLYVEKYVITYQQAPAYTATLMEGDDLHTTLTEAVGGAGVLLPSLPDKEIWQFMGWTATSFEAADVCPELYLPNTRIYPTDDMTLWAVWRYMQDNEELYLTDMQSGDYIYANTDNQLAITGVVENGRMQQALINPLESNQIYHIDFDPSAQTATIQHLLTDQYVGYKDATLVAEPTEWLVWQEGNKTVFYTLYDGKKYVLWQNMIDEQSGQRYAGLYATNDVSKTPTALIYPQQQSEQLYTCYPEENMAVESVTTTTNEIIVPFGIYEIHIIRGEKYIRLRQ